MKTIVMKTVDRSEAIVSDRPQRFPEGSPAGSSARQGDVYITLLDVVPAGCKIDGAPSQQLAPGNTQGSRHCLKNMRRGTVNVYRLPNPTVYDGPILELLKPNVVTHPEHGDWSLPAGVYAISYQRTEDSEGRQRRVQD